jgi:hypothetical protein
LTITLNDGGNTGTGTGNTTVTGMVAITTENSTPPQVPSAPIVSAPVEEPVVSNQPLGLISTQISSLNPQVFFDGSTILSNSTFINAITGDSSGAHASAGFVDSTHTSSNKNNYVASWGWEHTPAFINLVPIVEGLTNTLNTLEATQNVQHDSSGLGVLVGKISQSSISSEVNVVGEQKVVASANVPLAEKLQKELLASKQVNNMHAKLDQAHKEMYATRMNFEQRVKALLQDFGFFD